MRNPIADAIRRLGVWVILLLLLIACDANPTSTAVATPGVESPLLISPLQSQSTPVAESPLPEPATPIPATETAVNPTSVPATLPAATATPVPATPTRDIPTATAESTRMGGEGTAGAGYALRFFGTGSGDIDRVKIGLDNPPVPADVGSTDFTLEWWMKANPGENTSGDCATGNDNWITGNIMFDRDIWGNGDYGDFGVSIAGGRIAFGVNNGAWGEGICSQSQIADGQWHHIAVIRRLSDGQMSIFVDGQLEAQMTGPEGDVSYRDGRSTDYANDPFLVIGAEKHDAGPEYPSFSGWIDEVRMSNVIRYSSNFVRPSAPFDPDEYTVALWHFDEGAGDIAQDASPGGLSDGLVRIGGPQTGPQWVVSDAPLARTAP